MNVLKKDLLDKTKKQIRTIIIYKNPLNISYIYIYMYIYMLYNTTIIISIQRYIYIFIYSQIQIHLQTGGLRCSDTNGLTSDFGSSTRGERQFLKVYRNHPQRNHTIVIIPNAWHISCCFRSQFIFASRDPKNLTAAATVENLTLWQRTQFSVLMAETQFSACNGPISIYQLYGWTPTSQYHGRTPTSQHNGPTSTESFSKSSKFSAHLFRAWHHPHSSTISSLGFILTKVIVISFVCERKLHHLTSHLNS